MNRWLDNHQAISSAPSATSWCGWVSCACTNGVITLSASCGPISVCTAEVAASSARATESAPNTRFDSPNADPTAIVDGTSVSTAKNAISAAWPVVRCRLVARASSTRSDHGRCSASASSLQRVTEVAMTRLSLPAQAAHSRPAEERRARGQPRVLARRAHDRPQRAGDHLRLPVDALDEVVAAAREHVHVVARQPRELRLHPAPQTRLRVPQRRLVGAEELLVAPRLDDDQRQVSE